jgi:hypothetical protein
MFFENGRLRVVGIGGTLGEAEAVIPSTAAYHGTLAGVTRNALDCIHLLGRDGRPYLQGRVVGLSRTAGDAGNITVEGSGGRLERLGRLVEMAEGSSPRRDAAGRRFESVGVAP